MPFSLGAINLTKDGTTVVGTSKAPVVGAGGWGSYGNSTDLWGTTWTLAEINASTFGALLKAGDALLSTPSTDAMRITVYYTVPGGGGGGSSGEFDLSLNAKAWF